jgi:hypothetical protein
LQAAAQEETVKVEVAVQEDYAAQSEPQVAEDHLNQL